MRLILPFALLLPLLLTTLRSGPAGDREVSAADRGEPGTTVTSGDNSAAAAAGAMLVTPDTLARQLRDPALVVLHISDRPEDFLQGHIPAARFVRYSDFAIQGETRLGAELPPLDTVRQVFEAAGVSDSSRVVIYAPSLVVAARAFFTLDVTGHSNVAILDGGLRAWRAAGHPVETGAAATVPPGRFTPRLHKERLADAAFIQSQQPTRAIALLDVRPDDEYFGRNTMGGAHAPGHLAGAQQLPWTTLVKEERFLPDDELRQRFAAAGAASGKPVVAYCMIGMRASVVYFTARRLGYDVRLYDGSIVDWSRRGLPTVITEKPQ